MRDRGDPAALKRAIEIAMPVARLTSWEALAIRSGVHVDTIKGWFPETGRAHGPSLDSLLKVADACEVDLSRLVDAYQGREPKPDSAEAALRGHTRAVERQNVLLGSLVAALRSGALNVALALSGADTEGRLAALAQAATDVAPRPTGEAGEPSRPDEGDTGAPPRSPSA